MKVLNKACDAKQMCNLLFLVLPECSSYIIKKYKSSVRGHLSLEAEAERPGFRQQLQTPWDLVSKQKEGMEVTQFPQNYISIYFHSNHINYKSGIRVGPYLKLCSWDSTFGLNYLTADFCFILSYSIEKLIIKEFSWHLTISIISKLQRAGLGLQLKSRILA